LFSLGVITAVILIVFWIYSTLELNKGCLNASSQLIRSYYFIFKHFLMKSLLYSEIFESNGTGLPRILFNN